MAKNASERPHESPGPKPAAAEEIADAESNSTTEENWVSEGGHI